MPPKEIPTLDPDLGQMPNPLLLACAAWCMGHESVVNDQIAVTETGQKGPEQITSAKCHSYHAIMALSLVSLSCLCVTDNCVS